MNSKLFTKLIKKEKFSIITKKENLWNPNESQSLHNV